MRHPSELLQSLVASSRSMMSKASFVPDALDLTYRAGIKTVIFAIAFVLLFSAGKAMFTDHVVIEPISVPRKLEEDGYSGTVVSRLLLAEVQTIRQSADTLEFSAPTNNAQVRFSSEDEFATLATIQVPSSSLTLRSITVMLRDFLGIPEQKIGGAITIIRPDGPDKPVVYRVALLLGPSASLSAKPEENANLDEAIRLSARSIARQYDPVGLAAYYIKNRRPDEMNQLAADLIEARERQQRKQGLFIRGLHEDKVLQKIAFFQQAIDEDPDFSDAYNAWGSALVRKGDADAAIEKYREAIRLNPSNSSAFRNRAIAYRDKGLPQLAAADFEQAGKLNPTAQTFFDLGRAYEDLKKRDLAIKAYDEAIRLDARHPFALNNRCYLRAIRGDRLAIADCDKALLLLSPNFETYDSRGFAYLKLNELDKAIADYDTALNRYMPNPGLAAWSQFGRGVAKRRKGDLAGGDADIAEALKNDSEMASKMAAYDVRP